MVRLAGKHRGAASAADTLFTTGRDAGHDVADGLQDAAVGGHVDDAPGAAQLNGERGTAASDGAGETLAVQAQIQPSADAFLHRVQQPVRATAVDSGAGRDRPDDRIQIGSSALVGGHHIDPVGVQRPDLVDKGHAGAASPGVHQLPVTIHGRDSGRHRHHGGDPDPAGDEQVGRAGHQRETVTRPLHCDQLAGPNAGVHLHRPTTPHRHL